MVAGEGLGVHPGVHPRSNTIQKKRNVVGMGVKMDRGLLWNPYDQGLFISLPIQSLAAAVAKPLMLPVHRDAAPWTNGKGISAMEEMNLHHCHRQAEGFRLEP